MDQQHASQGPDGSYDLKDSNVFSYEALSKELFVGNVYLRVYNDQPDYGLSEPEAFCGALIDFIASLVHGQSSVDSKTQSKINDSKPPTNTSELQGDMTDAPIDEQHIIDDSPVESDGKAKEKEENLLIKNLRSGLTSLQVIYSLVHYKL